MSLHSDTQTTLTARGAEQRRIPLNVLFGVPDDGNGLVRVSPDGGTLIPSTPNTTGRVYILRGSTNLAPYMSQTRFALNKIYLQHNSPHRVRFGPGAILNHIADPDICSQALGMAARILRQVQRPCFNHPAAVARTTRDGVARAMSGIPGLIVPKTIRVQQSTPALVREAAEQANLRYPLLVRVAGSHGGQDRLRVERPDGLAEIAQLKRKGQPLNLTEFCDFASPDGLYRKFRIVVVGGEIFLRQCVIGGNWSLHGRSRVAGTEEEEAVLLDRFHSDWAPSLKPIFSEMTRRLDLDYYGVDCHIDADRRVLLFEANPCMKILKNYRPSPNRFDAPIARIKHALEALLGSPETWRHARTRQTAAAFDSSSPES